MSKKIEMLKSEFENLETYTACPYCMDPIAETWLACCGEAGHGEKAYEDVRGENLTETEFDEKYNIVDDEPQDGPQESSDEDYEEPSNQAQVDQYNRWYRG